MLTSQGSQGAGVCVEFPTVIDCFVLCGPGVLSPMWCRVSGTWENEELPSE